MRFIRVFSLVAVLAGVFASVAAAGGYTDASYLTPVGRVGMPYSHRIEWKPGTGCPPYGYSFDGGAFPPGLTLSGNGYFSGTPTQAGTFVFYVEQTDNCGPEGQGNSPFKITIEPGAPPSVTTASLKPAIVGIAYLAQLTASAPGVTFQSSGGSFPAGLTLAPNGTVSGTPTTPGDATFSVTVTNGSGTSQPKQLTLKIVEPLKLTAQPPRALEVGVDFNATIAASGGVPAYAWSVGALPAGLMFDSATGVLSGTPTVAGASTIKITLADTNASSAELDLKLVVAHKLSLTTTRLKGLRAGRAYAAKLVVGGGVRPLKWAIAGGKLPGGIRFSARAGAFVGVARTAGKFRVRVRVTDSLGAISTRYLLLSVR